MYVDVFQDSTGITNLTNTSRDSNEFISSITGSLYVRQNLSGLSAAGGNIDGEYNSNNANALTRSRDAVEGSTTDANDYSNLAYTTNSIVSGYLIADLGASYSISQLIIGKGRSHGDARSIKMRYHATQTDPQANGTDIDFTKAVSTVYSNKG